jgi:tetratricopeptide (TPR) repeat protein
MGGEVLRVLQAGLAADEFTADDPYYVEVLAIAQPRAAEDRRLVATYVREGEGGDARDALAIGDVFYSMEDYAQAAHFYQLAVERGLDSGTANTRLGIALTKAGDYAAAREAFAQVTCIREATARLWSVYADTLAAQ